MAEWYHGPMNASFTVASSELTGLKTSTTSRIHQRVCPGRRRYRPKSLPTGGKLSSSIGFSSRLATTNPQLAFGGVLLLDERLHRLNGCHRDSPNQAPNCKVLLELLDLHCKY